MWYCHYSDIADNSGNTQSPTSTPSTEKSSSPRVSDDDKGFLLREIQPIGMPSPSSLLRRQVSPSEEETPSELHRADVDRRRRHGGVDSKILDNVKISKYLKNIIKFYDSLKINLILILKSLYLTKILKIKKRMFFTNII